LVFPGSSVTISLPGLREEPDEPDPRMLVRYEVVEEVSAGTLPVQVVRHGIPEPTGVLVAKTAGGDEESDGHWDGQNDGEGERESLHSILGTFGGVS